MYRSLLFLIVALVAVLVAGCASPAASSPINNTPAANESPVATPGSASSPVATPMASGELSPQIAANALGWLATQSNLSVTDLRLVNAERTEWTDGCFGLGGPAESCLAAMTPGWRITFEANGEQYEVRTDEAGTSFRVAPKVS